MKKLSFTQTGDAVNTNPLVSVIVGFLNAEKFIQETIETVIAQTYSHWELLLVDDGSTDKSTAIARSYAEQYPEKVFYLEHEGHQNRGVCVSRNLGVAHARGEYIAILDADDVWLPHKLERQVEILKLYPEAAMVYGATEYWSSWRGNPSGTQRDFTPKLGLPANILYNPPALVTLCYPLGKAAAPCPSDLLLRREIIERIGGFEEEFRGKYQLFEDQAFLVKVYLNGAVFVSDECWDRYRLHPDSCMVGTKNHYLTVRLFFLNWLRTYLSAQEIKDPDIWQALEDAYWPYRHPILFRLISFTRYPVATIKPYIALIGRILPTDF